VGWIFDHLIQALFLNGINFLIKKKIKNLVYTYINVYKLRERDKRVDRGNKLVKRWEEIYDNKMSEVKGMVISWCAI
jgi:hypothetical protein